VSTIEARILTPEGVETFREYLSRVQEDPLCAPPDLNDAACSRPFSPRVDLDSDATFESKLELAEYLHERFRGCSTQALAETHLWSWLAWLWFDMLAPVTKKRTRVIRSDALYICTPGYRTRYRHLVYGPFSVYCALGRDDSRLLLSGPVYRHGDFMEQVASRRYLMRGRGIIRLINRLYWDPGAGKPRRGALSYRKRGTLRRLIRVLEQFELTYNIYSMTEEQLLKLLPSEFDLWKHQGAA